MEGKTNFGTIHVYPVSPTQKMKLKPEKNRESQGRITAKKEGRTDSTSFESYFARAQEELQNETNSSKTR
ncbi:MAG: hypothetical protein PHN72_03660 [Bacilli bacterium]|nr:hypothetical protein [Bacilli bacterium]